MDSLSKLWPENNHSLWDIKNQKYVIEIKWSNNLFEDYKKLANEYYQCGFRLIREILLHPLDNIKTDIWFLSAVFLMRQSIELGLKALICRVFKKKSEIHCVFKEYKHRLIKLFERYIEEETDCLLSNEEIKWLSAYFASVEVVDLNSDVFRFPFEEEFLLKFRFERIDITSVANNLFQAVELITKCIDCDEPWCHFDDSLEPKFLSISEHYINTCYIWEPFSIGNNGFASKISSYVEAADFIFYCHEITIEEKLYPLIYILRNTIELYIKKLLCFELDNGVPRNIYDSKRRSHEINKDLWLNVRPIIEQYAIENDEEVILSVLDTVDTQILEIECFDKKGMHFRYPASYSLEYKYNGDKIDIKNLFEYMRGIINFLDCCDSIFYSISDYESEMRSYNE